MLVLAAATALIGLPASAQSIHIATAGKTPDQVHTDVVKAANRLCAVETYGASFPIDEMSRCVDYTTRAALGEAADPKLKFARR
jgi:hypothetical protein